MSKIYTKTGDDGSTGLIGGKRVSKHDFRLKAYGDVDELNSVLGIVRNLVQEAYPEEDLIFNKIQSALFSLGSHLACEEDKRMVFKLPSLDTELIKIVEGRIDFFQNQLPELKNFILPSGSLSSTHCHLARTVCRRVERSVLEAHNQGSNVEPEFLVFLNRLSDYFFALARFLNFKENVEEKIWKN